MNEGQTLECLRQEIETCRRCARLVVYREKIAREKRRAYRQETYWGRPVAGFGDPHARVVLIGLAPAAHGANRTGRMFTGDASGRFLFAALHRAGFASQPTSTGRDDGLRLQDAYIVSVVRCAPPNNRPSPGEIRNCMPFLARELACLTRARIYLCLGRLAWDVVRRQLRQEGAPLQEVEFAHGAMDLLPPPWPTLIASYHPSQQNTQTGRLTPAMMDAVLDICRRRLVEHSG